MSITAETKLESFIAIQPKVGQRHKECLHLLEAFGPSTVNQLARYAYLEEWIPYPIRNYYHPRLNELVAMELVEVIGKKIDIETKHSCAVYAIRREQQ